MGLELCFVLPLFGHWHGLRKKSAGEYMKITDKAEIEKDTGYPSTT